MGKIDKLLQGNPYPGRGILLGRSGDGACAVIAYFIMGRSENSRNRIFVLEGDGIRTQAFDPAKVADPSLIIYAPVRVQGADTIVTNGDQTDTIACFLSGGRTFEDALRKRTFEPDAPNYTPRISGILRGFDYKLSILKAQGGNPDITQRFFYEFSSPAPGTGHLIHTYRRDGEPLPSFEGEPVCVEVRGGIDSFTQLVWGSLDPQNRVSLFTRFICVEDGSVETRVINQNQLA